MLDYPEDHAWVVICVLRDTNMRVPDEVRDSIMFVGLRTVMGNGQVGLHFVGTVFVVAQPSEGILSEVSHIYLVTARHVADALDGKDFCIRANTAEGSSVIIEIRGNQSQWIYHPDPRVDVALFGFAPPPPVSYKAIGRSMFLTDETIKSGNIGTGDEVFITGLFAHMARTARNIPIVRIGNIAMMPTEPVPTSFGETDAYLIEARSIGGLSGSPAFVRQSVSVYFGSRENVMQLSAGSFFLLGLMHGHWDIPPESRNDEFSEDQADINRAVNMGIAIAVPASKIVDILDLPELVQQRQKSEEDLLAQRSASLDIAPVEVPANIVEGADN